MTNTPDEAPASILDPVTHAKAQFDFALVVPWLEEYAQLCFQECPSEQGAEAVAATLALAWLWHRSLADAGVDASDWHGLLARQAVQQVKQKQTAAGHPASVVSPAVAERPAAPVPRQDHVGRFLETLCQVQGNTAGRTR